MRPFLQHIAIHSTHCPEFVGLKDFLCSAHLLRSFYGQIYTYGLWKCLKFWKFLKIACKSQKIFEESTPISAWDNLLKHAFTNVVWTIWTCTFYKEKARGAISTYCSKYCQVKHCLHGCCRASWPLPAARQSRHAPDQADCSDCVHTDGDILSGGRLQAAEEVGPAGPLQTAFQHRQRPTDSKFFRCPV